MAKDRRGKSNKESRKAERKKKKKKKKMEGTTPTNRESGTNPGRKTKEEKEPRIQKVIKTREHPTKSDETTGGEYERAKRNRRDSSQRATPSLREILDPNESET